MLDQKLIRENPTFVENNLSLRGKVYDITAIHKLTLERKEIDIEISSLQSESKKLSKIIGQKIRNMNNANSQELNELKDKGNKYRIKVSEFEEKKRILDQQLQEEISKLPIAAVRAFLEISVVTVGWYLGGTVGIGTLLFAFGIGPAVALGLFLVGKVFNN